jgi:uncharacterized protein involved in oxidation of intracellular sulfur
MQIQKDFKKADLCIFLMTDLVICALSGRITPNGYYNIERMLRAVILKNDEIKSCGSCADAMVLKDLKLVEGVGLSSIKELTH